MAKNLTEMALELGKLGLKKALKDRDELQAALAQVTKERDELSRENARLKWTALTRGGER